MRWNSVRLRLTLWNVSVLALVLAGYALVLTFTIPRMLAAEVDSELEGRAARVARWYSRYEAYPTSTGTPNRWWAPFIDRGDEAERRSERSSGPLGTTQADRRGYFRRPRLLSTDGEALVPFSGDVPWDPDTFLISLGGQKVFSKITVENETLRVLSMPLWRGGETPETGEIEGVVQVAHALGEHERLTAGLIRFPLALIPVALIVAGLGGVFLTHRALRPVRDVTLAAAQINAEDLSRRLEVRGKDELAELARTFNGMIGRLEEAFGSLESAYSQLEAAYEQQRRFTGDASHELRTPLTRIKGSASLALSRVRTPEEYQNSLRIINKAADAMNEIVQDLLLLARADSGQLNASLRATSLPDLVEAAVAELPGDGAPIRVEVSQGLTRVQADAGQLRRVLVNLLMNARRHTPSDGEITIAASDGNGRVSLTVRDTGEGIPPEHLPYVCERFYRVDAARSRGSGGTGLGLAICQSIVQAHHGTLTVESEVGVGTTVTVALPAAPSPAPTAGETQPV